MVLRTEENNNVVVGASVAGLFAAYQLARAGERVQVYEAQAELMSEARTLIVTPAWLDLFDFDASAAVLNRTRIFELYSRGASARIPLREPDVIMERVTFLRLLARKVRAAGGELIMGHRFEGLASGGGGEPLNLRFRTAQGVTHVDATTVIGADGVHSAVARAVGRDGLLDEVTLLQARVALPPDLASDTVRCWFERDRTRFFYWLIPQSEDEGVVGLIGDTEAQTHAALEHLMATQDLDPIEYQEEAWTPIFSPRFQPEIALGAGRVLLVGDAAGQVKVTTVGGVVTGMAGAAAAARSILRGTSYTGELRSLRWELSMHALVRHVLDGFTDAEYDQLLQLLNRQAVRVLSQYHRDELARALWRLLPAQPQWLSLGARAVMQRLLGEGQRLYDVATRSA